MINRLLVQHFCIAAECVALVHETSECLSVCSRTMLSDGDSASLWNKRRETHRCWCDKLQVRQWERVTRRPDADGVYPLRRLVSVHWEFSLLFGVFVRVCVFTGWNEWKKRFLINMSSSVWRTNNDSAHQRDAVYVNDMFLQLLSTSIYMHLGHANPLQPSSVCASRCLPLSMPIRDACRIVLEWLAWTSVREVRISGDLTIASVIVISLMFCDVPFICNSHRLQLGCAIFGSDI